MITLTLDKQGETLTFLTAPDAAAAAVELELRLAPGARGPEPHRHPRQAATFSVVEGTLELSVDGATRTLEAGESFTVEAGSTHAFTNASATAPLVARVTVEPGLRFQWLLTELSKAAIRGGGSWKDLPLLEAAYILHVARGEYELAGMPVVVQRILFRALAALAVATGRAANVAEPVRAAPAAPAVTAHTFNRP